MSTGAAAAAVPSVSAPSTILLLRIKSVVVPLPWLLLWLFAALLVPLSWVVGYAGGPWLDTRTSLLLRKAHYVVMILAGLRGLTVAVESGKNGDETDIFLKWI
jgi:hypothetical protein